MNFINPEARDRRSAWRATRAQMEKSGCGQSLHGPVHVPSMHAFYKFVGLFNLARFPYPFPRLHAHLMARAKDIRLVHRQIRLASLPVALDGYRIIHFSDPHFDSLPGLEDSISSCLAGVSADAMVITGDFVDKFFAGPDAFIAPLGKILSSVKVRDGVFAVLGNHDSWRHVESLESLGIRVLINESTQIFRDGASLGLTGIDDPSYFFTPDAIQALGSSPCVFNILLAHSPELADLAARSGYALYLAGHTHGGQICLPNGRPMYTSLRRFRSFYEGMWSHGCMVGYTSVGAGVSLLPYRLFKRNEVACLTLRHAPGETKIG